MNIIGTIVLAVISNSNEMITYSLNLFVIIKRGSFSSLLVYTEFAYQRHNKPIAGIYLEKNARFFLL